MKVYNDNFNYKFYNNKHSEALNMWCFYTFHKVNLELLKYMEVHQKNIHVV